MYLYCTVFREYSRVAYYILNFIYSELDRIYEELSSAKKERWALELQLRKYASTL